MNTKNILLPFTAIILFLFTACTTEAQNAPQKSTVAKSQIEIIQFHSEHRCMTCNKIEELTRIALKDYPSIPFSLVNVDDEKNAKKSEEFEAYGTSLFLFNPKTGAKKNLTEFAFMNAGNPDKFVEVLKKEINQFEN